MLLNLNKSSQVNGLNVVMLACCRVLVHLIQEAPPVNLGNTCAPVRTGGMTVIRQGPALGRSPKVLFPLPHVLPPLS